MWVVLWSLLVLPLWIALTAKAFSEGRDGWVVFDLCVLGLCIYLIRRRVRAGRTLVRPLR